LSKPKKKAAVIEDDEDDDHEVARYDDDMPDKGSDDEGDGEKKEPVAADGITAEFTGEAEEEDPVQETRIDVEVPKISTDLGQEVNFIKLPNFLSVDCRPYDPETYEDEIDDDDCLDEEGRERLKLKVENTIRWRIGFDEEGRAIKESNARMVKWSDGSYSMHLGNEVFDVTKQPLQGDFNHLFIRQGTGLQGQAVFRTKMSFRPHSTDSFTHQKMTRSMADRSTKKSGIKIISQIGNDPEAGRYQRVKQEEERLRMDLRRESNVKRVKEGASKRALSSGYLEGGDSDDEGGVSLAAIKNKYKKNKNKKQAYSSDEDAEDSDVEAKKARKLEHAKNALRDSESDSGSNRSRSPVRRSRSRSGSRSRSRSRSGSGSRSASPAKSGGARSRSGSPSGGSRKSGSGSASD